MKVTAKIAFLCILLPGAAAADHYAINPQGGGCWISDATGNMYGCTTPAPPSSTQAQQLRDELRAEQESRLRESDAYQQGYQNALQQQQQARQRAQQQAIAEQARQKEAREKAQIDALQDSKNVAIAQENAMASVQRLKAAAAGDCIPGQPIPGTVHMTTHADGTVAIEGDMCPANGKSSMSSEPPRAASETKCQLSNNPTENRAYNEMLDVLVFKHPELDPKSAQFNSASVASMEARECAFEKAGHRPAEALTLAEKEVFGDS